MVKCGSAAAINHSCSQIEHPEICKWLEFGKKEKLLSMSKGIIYNYPKWLKAMVLVSQNHPTNNLMYMVFW